MRKLPLPPVVHGLFALLLLSGCATQNLPQKRDPRDPFEPVNRVTYRFNDAIDTAVAKPVARTYKRVAPRLVQRGISNFFDNLTYPAVLVNDLLQGKFAATSNDVVRLVVNTTIGIGGLLDPASAAGLDKNDEDFGQTLGRWGLRSGPYLMLPLLGPSTVRDGLSRGVDHFADPLIYSDNQTLVWSVRAVGFVDLRARLLDVEKPLESAYDRYALLRSVYLQRREYQVHDGDVPEELEAEPMLDETPAPSQ
jgi:phospholipid-binding lipoprotein MlaA